MSPAKNSLAQEALPPIRSTPDVVLMRPARATERTNAPFKYRFSNAPSYVIAMCVHVLVGITAVPVTPRMFAPTWKYPAGRLMVGLLL